MNTQLDAMPKYLQQLGETGRLLRRKRGSIDRAESRMSIFNGTTWYLQLVTAVWGESKSWVYIRQRHYVLYYIYKYP